MVAQCCQTTTLNVLSPLILFSFSTFGHHHPPLTLNYDSSFCYTEITEIFRRELPHPSATKSTSWHYLFSDTPPPTNPYNRWAALGLPEPNSLTSSTSLLSFLLLPSSRTGFLILPTHQTHSCLTDFAFAFPSAWNDFCVTSSLYWVSLQMLPPQRALPWPLYLKWYPWHFYLFRFIFLHCTYYYLVLIRCLFICLWDTTTTLKCHNLTF